MSEQVSKELLKAVESLVQECKRVTSAFPPGERLGARFIEQTLGALLQGIRSGEVQLARMATRDLMAQISDADNAALLAPGQFERLVGLVEKVQQLLT